MTSSDNQDNSKDLKSLSFGFDLKEFKVDEEYFFFKGYASTFGNVDLGKDVVVKGAFKATLAKKKPKLCYQHRMSEPLGVIDKAYEDEFGLYVEGRMPRDNQQCKDVASLLKIGAIDSFSIGYSAKDVEMRTDGVRLLKELELWEVSFVTVPMNPKAKVTDVKTVKTVSEIKELVHNKRDFENILRESGLFSNDACKWLASCFVLHSVEADDEKANVVNAALKEFHKDLTSFVKPK